MSLPNRYRVAFELFISFVCTIASFSLFLSGCYLRNWHTIIWSWFAGFCSLRLLLMHTAHLRRKMHDQFDPEQLVRFKFVAAYLMIGSLAAFGYYLTMIACYDNFFDVDYRPACASAFLSFVFLNLLMVNAAKYREYLLTEHLPISG